jgi:hypothetical protein
MSWFHVECPPSARAAGVLIDFKCSNSQLDLASVRIPEPSDLKHAKCRAFVHTDLHAFENAVLERDGDQVRRLLRDLLRAVVLGRAKKSNRGP